MHSGGFRGVSEVSIEPPFGLHVVLKTTDDRLSGTPLSGYRTKKTSTITLAYFSRKFVQKLIDSTGWASDCSQKRSKMGVGSNFLRALCIQENPL